MRGRPGGVKLPPTAAWAKDPGADEETREMTPQDVVSLAPPRGLLLMLALAFTSMMACFWTHGADLEAELVRRD
ncbi:hypothetical protein [Caulobacter vibrioides]|uniref:Uncharacterized protein n=1 Tax=Caulobacter vibrioides (strain NA1000 / CB15N) TaxID=565050 RepID=A0A0H3CDF0_CAUVN|nr:hypothetical protein [Caulobacter vibrioides]YP_002518863.1 hypothetical protein CCNA_03490 [Caulobacter vibrioides NA1000]ACL96955.1 hypothetical protein CCNA_03490 [Caulobacter vibrioides NA1000]ATC30201.1 hypothetical protein CA607_18140 [Caulobacter vibrioides]QXZ51727.1 hypothetical protein KZH45_17890 [Caulobacter vibrioides]